MPEFISALLNGIGIGPALSILGLVLDGFGVVISLWPYVFLRDKEIAFETEAILTADWSHGLTQQQWLKTQVGKTKLKQRRTAVIGLACLASGFFLQAIGNYIWAST